MKIYQILKNGYLGNITEVPDGTLAIPMGNTRTVPPEIPAGSYAIWQGTEWGLTATPPQPVVQVQDTGTDPRIQAVSEIKVTTQAGNTFDGDETSQNRMARAIVAMTETDTIGWVLADNSLITVTREELQEALRLAGLAMTEIWVNK